MNATLRNELRRAVCNRKYERTENGVFFPAARFQLGGVFSCRVDGGPLRAGHNAVAYEFIDLLLNVALGNASAPSAWYVAPFTGSTTPTPDLKASNFATTLGEYKDYVEPTRQQWTKDGASSGQLMQNAAAPAVFTIGTGGATITGGALLSTSAKGSATGVLAAAGLFDAANTLGAGSKLTVEYGISGAAV